MDNPSSPPQIHRTSVQTTGTTSPSSTPIINSNIPASTIKGDAWRKSMFNFTLSECVFAVLCVSFFFFFSSNFFPVRS